MNIIIITKCIDSLCSCRKCYTKELLQEAIPVTYAILAYTDLFTTAFKKNMYDVEHIHFTISEFACADLKYREKIIFIDTEGLTKEFLLFKEGKYIRI